MKESIRYRNTPTGIEFCHYEIQKDSHQNKPVFTMQYSYGSMGSIADCDAVIDDNIDCINEVKTALLKEFPIEHIRTRLYKLELDLTHYKEDITSALLGQLSRSIQWNIKHSGLGFNEVRFIRKENILKTKLRLNSNLNLHEILAWDLGHLGIKPNQIKIY
jgi:hypothetical protein